MTVRVNCLNDCSVNVLLNIIFWINMFTCILMKTFTLLVCHFFDSVPPPDVKHSRYPECCVLPGVNVIYTSIWPPRDRISVYPFSHQSSCYTSFAYISTWNFFIFFKETFIFKRFSRCFVGKRCHCSFMT